MVNFKKQLKKTIFYTAYCYLYKNIKFYLYRTFPSIDCKLIQEYLSRNDIKKLQLGCGENPIIGWLNSDFIENCYSVNFDPSRKVVNIDVTKPLPFLDNTFDFVFCEHMIEHLSLKNAIFMLREVHRILKKDGILRIACPDLEKLVDVYLAKSSPEYINKIINDYCKNWVAESPFKDPICMLNLFFSDEKWGHKFLYDYKFICKVLGFIGYTNPSKYPVCVSDNPNLILLENIKRMGRENLDFETLVIEVTK